MRYKAALGALLTSCFLFSCANTQKDSNSNSSNPSNTINENLLTELKEGYKMDVQVTEVIDDIYTKEEAKNKAVETAKEKLLLKYSNIKEVKDVTIVNEISNDEQLNLTLFVKAYEDITKYREVIINEEDTTS